ncbi:MAG TPA: serine hydrolase domain-containing protein [Longimicrobium sp.]
MTRFSFASVRSCTPASRAALVARVAVAASIVGVAPAAEAQDLMAMNRAGRWAEVIPAAEVLLRDPALSAERACETRAELIHAATYAGRVEKAREAMRAFDARCASFPQDAWFRREVQALAERLGSAPAAGMSRTASAPLADGGGWRAGNAAALGLDTAALARHRALCEGSGADACLVAFRGRIVQEWYGPEYRYPMPTMSSMKSWTGLLAGLLVADGRIGLDDPVARWLPEWRAGAGRGVTLRHLLTMTGGLRRRWGRGPGDEMVGGVSDKNALVLSLPLERAPGERWEYSNEGAQLLSPLLERAAGRPLREYAAERLFAPLQMDSTSLRLDGAGHAWTYADARTTLRDFAKICQLALDGGRWNGRQVVPEAWIRASLTPSPRNPAYGFLWWLGTDPTVYATRGYLDTDCEAYPEWGLVVARMQARPRPGAQPYRTPGTTRLLAEVVRHPLPAPRP